MYYHSETANRSVLSYMRHIRFLAEKVQALANEAAYDLSDNDVAEDSGVDLEILLTQATLIREMVYPLESLAINAKDCIEVAIQKSNDRLAANQEAPRDYEVFDNNAKTVTISQEFYAELKATSADYHATVGDDLDEHPF